MRDLRTTLTIDDFMRACIYLQRQEQEQRRAMAMARSQAEGKAALRAMGRG